MIYRVRHTYQALTRFLAFALIVLFSVVRIAALLHTHDHDGTYEHRTKLALTENTFPSPSTTPDKHSTSEDDCALCDLLLHSHGEAASGLVFETLYPSVAPCEPIATPHYNTHYSGRILADRAPPAFLAFA